MYKLRLYFICLLLTLGLWAKAQIPFEGIDVQHYTFAITLNDDDNSIKGKADVTIKFTQSVAQVQLNLVKQSSTGKGMLVTAITEAGKKLNFSQADEVLNILQSEKENSIHTFTITYEGIPAKGLIIANNRYGNRTFFGDNWPNLAHNWLPCADYPADKATVDFLITAPDHYQVVSNGIKVSEKQLDNHTQLTVWNEAVPISTKLMVIGVADFAVDKAGEIDGIPVYTYMFPENKENGFESYAGAPQILSFYIKKLGPYAFKQLANVQSRTVYQAMENAGAIFYGEQFSWGKFIEELMAHEIAHQWFGDAISEKTWLDLWLSEGFADYMCNNYLENKYGSDTLKKRMSEARDKVLAYDYNNASPVVNTAVKYDYKQLLNVNSYDKGCWVLHMLRHKLGDTVFWKGIRAYYAKYNGGNANTDDFRQVMEQVSGQDLKQFFKQWLYTAGYPQLKVLYKYDAAKKVIYIQVEQKQAELYKFPLEYTIDGKLYTVDVKEKRTIVQISANSNPEVIIMDPGVNLLAGIALEEYKQKGK